MYERNEQMKEIYIIYSKKLVTDKAFDYRITVNSSRIAHVLNIKVDDLALDKGDVDE